MYIPNGCVLVFYSVCQHCLVGKGRVEKEIGDWGSGCFHCVGTKAPPAVRRSSRKKKVSHQKKRCRNKKKTFGTPPPGGLEPPTS
jgi:hypothetical protein